MEPTLTRLTPATRWVLRIVGPALVVLSVAMMVWALNDFLDQVPSAFQSFQLPRPNFFWFMGAPFVFFVGSWLTWLGFIKPVSEIVVTETGGAVEYGATRLGAGVARGLQQVGAGSTGTLQLVKVKCRGCGFLETEDARFCSRCGVAI